MWKNQGVWLIFLFRLYYVLTVGKLKTNSAKGCNFLAVVDNLISKCIKNLEDLKAHLSNSYSPQRIRLQLQTTLRPDVIYWSRRMVMYKKVTIVDLQNNSLGVVFWVNTVICVLRSFMEDLYRNTSSKNTRKDLKCRQFFIFCVFPPKLKDTYICCGYWKNKKKWKLVRAPFFS